MTEHTAPQDDDELELVVDEISDLDVPDDAADELKGASGTPAPHALGVAGVRQPQAQVQNC